MFLGITMVVIKWFKTKKKFRTNSVKKIKIVPWYCHNKTSVFPSFLGTAMVVIKYKQTNKHTYVNK